MGQVGHSVGVLGVNVTHDLLDNLSPIHYTLMRERTKAGIIYLDEAIRVPSECRTASR
jgi:hypothetical protein